MKIAYLIITLLFPLSLMAQSKNTDKELDFQVTPFKNFNQTPESARYYYRTGYSIGSIGNEKGNFNLSSLGTRRYADEFYYGIDYSYRYGLEGLSANTFSFAMGHHFLTLRHRIKPYIGGAFGYTSVTDKSELGRPKSNGINLGLDVGFEIWGFSFLSINQGIRLDYNFLNEKTYDTMNFQELYMMLNFRF